MILLTIGSDRSLFRESAARERVRAYGRLVAATHIIVFTKRVGFQKKAIGENVYLYPTNSRLRLGDLWGAVFICRGYFGGVFFAKRGGDFNLGPGPFFK